MRRIEEGKDGVEMWQTHVRSLDELDEREVLLLRVSHNGWKKSVGHHFSLSKWHLVLEQRTYSDEARLNGALELFLQRGKEAADRETDDGLGAVDAELGPSRHLHHLRTNETGDGPREVRWGGMTGGKSRGEDGPPRTFRSLRAG